jgi:large subunit ribosomal protein L40
MRALAGALSALRLGAPCRAASTLSPLSRRRAHLPTVTDSTTTTTLLARQRRRALTTTATLQGSAKQRSPPGGKKGAVRGGAAGRGAAGGGGKRGGGGRRGKKGQPERLSENQLRVRVLRMGLHGPAPPPLRMARNRWLRHWTIHRAWLAYQKQLRQAREAELLLLYQSMQNACEELRTTAGPGTMEEGYLFRRAMMHDGVYGQDGVPIEYARYQTESPGREPWNHGWKR